MLRNGVGLWDGGGIGGPLSFNAVFERVRHVCAVSFEGEFK